MALRQRDGVPATPTPSCFADHDSDGRGLRTEIELNRREPAYVVSAMISRESLSDVVHVLAERIGGFEALMEARMKKQEKRTEQLETALEDGIQSMHRSNQEVVQMLASVLVRLPE